MECHLQVAGDDDVRVAVLVQVRERHVAVHTLRLQFLRVQTPVSGALMEVRRH